jgi:hypothetical protein
MSKIQRSILSRFTPLAGAALAVALAACSGDLASPAARAPQASAPQLLSAGGRLISNNVKYRDSSAPHATGRSGSARLDGVAVLGSGGVATLTITSSSLTSTAPRGEIAKAQIKVFDAAGTLLFVENHNKLSGRSIETFLLVGMAPGMRIQVQANIRGIDARRTDVVTITETVRLAPALTVDAQLPPDGHVGQPVVITGTVTEVNGDQGTRADCQLWVNGVQVDAAAGIWVDAGDAVSCAFTWTPTGPGNYDVEIRVVGGGSGGGQTTVPSDGGTISVNSGITSGYTAQAEDRSVATTNVLDYTWWRPDGSNKQYSNTETNTERTQTIHAQGTVDRAVQFPLAAVDLSVTSGGVTWQENTWLLVASALDNQGRPCASIDISAHGAMFFVCNLSGGGSAWGYERFAGRVTYHSTGFSKTFDVRDGYDNYYTWNDGYTTSESGGRMRDFNGGVTLNVRITDAGGPVTFTPVIPQVEFSNPLGTTPRTCGDTTPYWLEGGVLNTCTSGSASEFGTRGETTG